MSKAKTKTYTNGDIIRKPQEEKSQASSVVSLLDGVVGFSKKHEADFFFEIRTSGKRLRVEIKDENGLGKI